MAKVKFFEGLTLYGLTINGFLVRFYVAKKNYNILYSLNFEFAEINLKLAEGNESWGKNALLVDDAKRHLMVPLPQAAHSAVLRDFATTR